MAVTDLMPQEHPAVTLAMLAYNEAAVIEAVVTEAAEALQKTLPADSWELLIIDDGSRDATPQLLDRLAQQFPAMRVFHQVPNQGYVAATLAALREARGEIVCVFDGDGQQDPADVQRFQEKIASGYQVVFGWKRIRHDPLSRLILSRGLRLCARFFLHTRLHDINAGCRAFRRECIPPLQQIRHRINFIGPELYTRARLSDYRIGEVVVQHRAREGGGSSHPWKRIPGEIRDVLRYLNALKAELQAAGRWRGFR